MALSALARIGPRRGRAHTHAGVARRRLRAGGCRRRQCGSDRTSAVAAPPVVESPAAGDEVPAAPAVDESPPPKEPVSERQAESAALLPAASPSGNGDTTDYSVGADNTVVVQAAETLGHFADWSKVSSASLRALNKLHKNAMVTLGSHGQTRPVAGQRGPIRGGAPRLPSATAGEHFSPPIEFPVRRTTW